MNCDQAIELLPWLVNGTLDAGERQEVVEHLAGCAACRAALADTRTAWELFDWHPPAAALVAHAQGEAAPAAGAGGSPAGSRDAGAAQDRDPRGPRGVDGIADHLATCPSCAAEMELLRTSRALSDPAADERIALLPRRREEAAAGRTWRRSALAAGVVGLLACTGWFESVRQERALERRLSQESAARAAAPAALAAPNRGGGAAGEAVDSDLRRRADEAEARLQGLARDKQQLQETVAALSRRAADLQQRSVGLAAATAAAAPPVESAVLEEVRPAGQVERGSGEPAETVVPLSSGAANLLLDTRRSDHFPSYEIEIRDAQDHPVGDAVSVRPHFGGSQDSPDGFDIVLRRGALSKGAYTIHLFGRGASGKPSGESREPLGIYSIRVT
jgi:hypothetical protein